MNEAGAGSDFHLPDEILAVIPTDPYDQLDIARKITSMAIASRVFRLESETGRLKQKLVDRDRTISDLRDKLDHLQKAFSDTDSRLSATLDENMRLMSERDALTAATKKLSRDLAKLETFKRHLMQSLNDENSPQKAETVDIGTYDKSVGKAYSTEVEGSNGYTAPNLPSGSLDMGSLDKDASRQAGQRFSLTPYITPRLTPNATPNVTSTGGSPIYSTAGSPKMTSGTTSPTKSHIEGRASLSSWYPPSQQLAASSPPRGRPMSARTPRIDGKEFFRQARSRLTYEQFGAFLANIKELNAQRRSREETLRKAEEIFGTDNKDLFLSFQGLLNRSMS